ncbi:MAG TPA: sialidase family protein [Nitrolancea sp.]|jgi:hypothetical protein|nr:sialidase family protein [Nitrolancea sp.]
MVIEHTVDRGQTWAPVTPPAAPPLAPQYDNVGPDCDPLSCLAHIRFVTSEIGYLFGPDLFTTFDGGHTWTRQPGSPTYDLEPVGNGLVWRLVYSHTGCPGPCDWQLQQEQIGTDTWTSVAFPGPTDPANDNAQIVSNAQGQIVIPFYGHIAGGTTSQATFYLTDDRGKHWTQRADPCGTSKLGENDAYQSSMAPDGTLAVLCVSKSGGPDSPFMMTSTDGGRTFGPMRFLLPVTDDSFYNLVAAANQSTTAVATGGANGGGSIAYTLAISHDDGAT